MNLLNELWNDESGAVVSAELVLLGTLGVVGIGVGAAAVGNSIDSELEEVALSIRSLDQSYYHQGFKGCGAWTAGSAYTQPPVEESRAELREFIERERAVRAAEAADETETAPPAPDRSGEFRRESRRRMRERERQREDRREHWDGDDIERPRDQGDRPVEQRRNEV